MSLHLNSMSATDFADFETLVHTSEEEGYGFLRRMSDEWASGALKFSRPGECVAIVREGSRVLGVGGLCLDPYLRAGSVGRLRHMYVHPAHRSSGLGARILGFVLRDWNESFSRIRLRAANDASARFYESHGFVLTVDEDNCTHVLTGR